MNSEVAKADNCIYQCSWFSGTGYIYVFNTNLAEGKIDDKVLMVKVDNDKANDVALRMVKIVLETNFLVMVTSCTHCKFHFPR